MLRLLVLLCLAGCVYGQRSFDHYLLALSWSPEFCYSHPSDPQCTSSRHYGFVMHGLWPESRYGRGPEFCERGSGAPPIPRELLEIMPDPGLIRHEWAAHGTCTGLNPEAYFALVRRAFFSVRIPREFAAPRTPFNVPPGAIKAAFERANPGLPPTAIVIVCRERFLEGVEICMTRDLRPMPCPAPRDCYARSIRVAPVR